MTSLLQLKKYCMSGVCAAAAVAILVAIFIVHDSAKSQVVGDGAICTALPNGAVSWWPGDGNTSDIYGPHSGTALHTLAFASGKVDQAFSFDGSAAGIEIVSQDEFNLLARDFTFEFWVNPNDVPVFASLINKRTSGSHVNGYVFAVQGGAYVAYISSNVDGVSWDIARGFNIGTAPAGVWAHIAIVRSGDRISFYKNGELSVPGVITLSPGTAIAPNNEALRFGRESNGYVFNGLLDEIGFFKRALSQAEIQAIVNAGTAGKCKTGSTCGNNVVDTGEQCDGTTFLPDNSCNSFLPGSTGAVTCNPPTHPNACLVDVSSCATTACGNGVIEGAEQCDDGNAASADGCSNVCSTEAGYTCSSQPSVCVPTTQTGWGNCELTNSFSYVPFADEGVDLAGVAVSTNGNVLVSAYCSNQSPLYTCTWPAGSITELDAVTGAIVAQRPSLGWGATGPIGLAYDDRGYLWVSGYNENRIYQVRVSDWTLVSSFGPLPGDYWTSRGGALAFDGANLWMISALNVYKLSQTGEVLATYPRDADEQYSAAGIDYANGYIFIVNSNVVKVRDLNYNLVKRYAFPLENYSSGDLGVNRVTGEGYWGKRLADKIYKLHLADRRGGGGECGGGVVAACGNGALETGEQCDDGNVVSGDGCSSTCQIEVPPTDTTGPDMAVTAITSPVGPDEPIIAIVSASDVSGMQSVTIENSTLGSAPIALHLVSGSSDAGQIGIYQATFSAPAQPADYVFIAKGMDTVGNVSEARATLIVKASVTVPEPMCPLPAALGLAAPVYDRASCTIFCAPDSGKKGNGNGTCKGDDQPNVICLDLSKARRDKRYKVEAKGGNDTVFVVNAEGMRTYIDGGAGDDVLVGGASNDEIHGKQGNDLIYGGIGEDKLDGDEGDDYLDGGDGRDDIHGGKGNDKIDTGSGGTKGWTSGGDDDDQIKGGDGDDKLNGDGEGDSPVGGNDIICGLNGNDHVVGNAGDDQLFGGNGRDELNGQTGNDVLSGDAGNDKLYGGVGEDTHYGGDGDDDISGGDGDDVLYGGAGDDKLNGRGGDDKLFGDTGNDALHGEVGNDCMSGGDGNDVAKGAEGNDTVIGGLGRDEVVGGGGTNTLSAYDGTPDTVRGGEGVDTAYADPNGMDTVSRVETTIAEPGPESCVSAEESQGTSFADTFTVVVMNNDTSSAGFAAWVYYSNELEMSLKDLYGGNEGEENGRDNRDGTRGNDIADPE